ncbi:MAG TPA: EAL domain-containing protein [Thiobacillus sp.]
MSRATLAHSLKSPLARRLIVAMILFSASITLVATAIQLYQEYRNDLDDVETQFQQIGDVHLPTLTQSLWATNDKEIQLQLDGMLRMPNIVYAAVDETGRLHTQAGQRDTAHVIERRYALRHEHLGQTRAIGTLTVVASLDTIYAQLMHEAIQVLLNNALRTFLVALFIFVLFHRLVTRHLVAVADHLRSADPTAPVTPLALARAPTSTPDELDLLVASANNMQIKTRATLDALRDSEAELHRLAYYDSLTGLPNRILFNERLHEGLASARRRNRLVALMLLDLDRFKVVNDTMGHEAGDCLLRVIAARLQHSTRDGDTVSRLGGDEFALVFTDVGELGHVARLAQKVLSQFIAPVTIDGREVFTSASIGIALYPADTEGTDSLLKFADSAMYHAKEIGRNNYQFYSHDMTATVQARLRLETDLRHALDNHEFFLHYQPQVDTLSDRITGVEALLRWRDPAGNSIAPAQFIPLAEDTGLIVPIGKWVLETACAQLRRWHDAGHGELTVSVNVASRQFRDPAFTDTVGQAIASSGIPPRTLELEITESILLEHSDDTLRTLNDLKKTGVTLAIDDFGTGYSSLSYLKRFPIDRVKIDQSFVRDLADDSDDLAIVRAIVALARAMRLAVIAEGVETEAQLTLLRREDCHQYQGYFFARPMDAGSIDGCLQTETLESRRSNAPG